MLYMVVECLIEELLLYFATGLHEKMKKVVADASRTMPDFIKYR